MLQEPDIARKSFLFLLLILSYSSSLSLPIPSPLSLSQPKFVSAMAHLGNCTRLALGLIFGRVIRSQHPQFKRGRTTVRNSSQGEAVTPSPCSRAALVIPAPGSSLREFDHPAHLKSSVCSSLLSSGLNEPPVRCSAAPGTVESSGLPKRLPSSSFWGYLRGAAQESEASGGFCTGGWKGVNDSSGAQQSQVCLLSPGPDYLLITTSSRADFLLGFPSFLYKGTI